MHKTARAEEKRDRKEEEEKRETRGRVGKRWEGKGGKGRVRVGLVELVVGADAHYTPLAASINSALAL